MNYFPVNTFLYPISVMTGHVVNNYHERHKKQFENSTKKEAYI